jgi:hypothetical protein
MRKCWAVLVALPLCPGCSALHAYQSTATRMERPLFGWQPPGQGGGLRTDVPPDEDTRKNADLKACITSLAREHSPSEGVPIREVRAAQLEQCMQRKGWELQPVYIIVSG